MIQRDSKATDYHRINVRRAKLVGKSAKWRDCQIWIAKMRPAVPSCSHQPHFGDVSRRRKDKDGKASGQWYNPLEDQTRKVLRSLSPLPLLVFRHRKIEGANFELGVGS